MSDDNNLTVSVFLLSDTHLSLASLKRAQVHRYDVNATEDYCNIDVEVAGFWIWESGCTKISKGNTCSLALSKNGDLQLLDGNSVAWSTGTSGKDVRSLQLLNSGDLVLLDSSNAIVWNNSDHNFKNVDQACTAGTPMTTPIPAPTPCSELGSSSNGPASMQEPSGPEASAEGPALASHSSASSLIPAIIAIFLAVSASSTLFLG
ncbi:hypothetical protein O6H91_11G052200 [Diphasiastrum complanatum]|uniref:Uncharacterized protein n=1 Tax=Diphasiastrum complanatum TaxID=34168 RepID=A0ACC2C929_DIPCM|nr:hypothetical protein O6H91_11G052200 [Diphasiastrum complanatum]